MTIGLTSKNVLFQQQSSREFPIRINRFERRSIEMLPLYAFLPHR